MNPRISALLEVVRTAAQQEIGTLLATTRVHDFKGEQALRLLGDTVLGDNGNHYEIRIYPAIAQVEVMPECNELQFAFVVFSPTGELKTRRDTAELTRKPGTPNMAFVEMCADLMPVTPEFMSILDTLSGELAEFWPQRTLSFTMMGTSAELDVVAVFVDAETFRQVTLHAGRRMAS